MYLFDLVDAVSSFLRTQTTSPRVVGYALETSQPLRKYAGMADSLLSWRDEWFSRMLHGGARDLDDDAIHEMFLLSSFTPWSNYRAMATHASQFVWYRQLFVIFSRYTFLNTLKRINPPAVAATSPQQESEKQQQQTPDTDINQRVPRS